ncbi:MAG: T9SS type A sorting domain-containing protein [Flavobacteriales bacterium]
MIKKIIQQSRLALFIALIFALFSTSVKAQDSLNFLVKDVSNQRLLSKDLLTYDLDNDGDKDILAINTTIAGTYFGNIAWFENINHGDYFDYHVIEDGFIHAHFKVGDLDLDGDADILVASDINDKLIWYKNDGNQNFDSTTISNTFNDIENIVIKDYDQDGDMDIITHTAEDSKVLWFNNDGGQNFTIETIDSTKAFKKIIVEDLNLDGHLDIIGLANGRVDWYENDGSQNHTYHNLTTYNSLSESHDIILFDYDADADLDILNCRNFGLYCLINDGTNNFTDSLIGTTALKTAKVIDFDLDGDMDIFGNAVNYDLPIVYKQASPQIYVLDSLKDINKSAKLIASDDLNNDSLLDVVLFEQSKWEIRVFLSDSNQNYFGRNLLGSGQIINNESTVLDFDYDEDLDYITRNSVWHENLSNGKFNRNILNFHGDNSYNQLITDDIDDDGDYDFVSVSNGTGEVYWHEQDSNQKYISHPIVFSTTYFNRIKILDFDQDGDKDFIGFGITPNKLIWLKNDGFQNFTETEIMDLSGSSQFAIVDLDLDNDFDILTTFSSATNELRWLENDGNQNFTLHIIQSVSVGYRPPISLDYDNDGDIDLFMRKVGADNITLYENNGSQIFTSSEIITNNIPTNITFADLNQDNYKDLIYYTSTSTNVEINILINDSINGYSSNPITKNNYLLFISGDFDNDGDADLIAKNHNSPYYVTSFLENLHINNYLHLEYAPFIDNNSNNVLDSNEYTTDNIELIIQPNNIIQGSGVIENHLYLDIAQDFDITLNLDTNLWIPTDSFNRHISIDSIQPIDSTIYIGYRNKHSVLTSTDITGQWPRCNDTIAHQIKVRNLGNMLDTGYVQYNLDSLSEFVSASPSPDSVNGNQLFFGFNDLQTAQDKIVNVNIKLPLSIDTLEHELFTKADTGLNLIELINTKDFEELVRCSYDPNDKQVFPYYGDSGYVLPNTSLEYLIRFQNTGNDTAFIVNILDTLDTSLDLSSFELVSYSHPIQFTIQPDSREISFLFEDINLTDTITDEPGSHGFVKYRIKTEDTIVVNTEITNEAYIYFDENPPIITNSTSNLIYDCDNLGQHIAINNNEFYLLAGIPLQVDLNESFINSAQWTLDGTNISSDLTSLTQQLTTPGIHNLNIRLTNDLCSVDTTIQINVFDNVGYAELNSILKVYPNPVNNQLFIEFDQYYQNINIDIINQLGQKIDHFNFSDSKIIIPFYYEPGMYFLEITNDNQHLQRIKVVKK